MKRFVDTALVLGAFLVCATVFVGVVFAGTALVLGTAQIVTFLEAAWPN